MTFTGFTQNDFDVFSIPGLEGRMEGIQTRIQPKFKALGEPLRDELSLITGNPMYLHIAKHARRKVNAPVDTWMAIGHDKRGYKQHPHFQVGLFDDRIFVWLALIYELPNKKAIAESYLTHIKKIRRIIPKEYVLSADHMKKDNISFKNLKEQELQTVFERFRDIKKEELLIGHNIAYDNPILNDGQALAEFIKQTFETLMPLYQMARQASS
ncbi:DUF1054 domain-containing protein [Paenibacillus periandrae]|uniref:DUF1054 domain-containing protein n=1 Tax=Paenibacillus periandrae TaxID=1761741 RepID=UPI001F08B1EB|nr:DUF1054 domain-containing protein [Paenibacillus periandrae]